MIGIINSMNGLLIGTIICFFAFALQGFPQGALFVGLAALSLLGIKALLVSATTKERSNPIYAPSHSMRTKNKRRKLRIA